MKHDRNAFNQSQRIEREKANRLAVVNNLPDGGEEGDEIYRGEPPTQEDKGEGFYKRVQGKWVFIGGVSQDISSELDIIFATRLS